MTFDDGTKMTEENENEKEKEEEVLVDNRPPPDQCLTSIVYRYQLYGYTDVFGYVSVMRKSAVGDLSHLTI